MSNVTKRRWGCNDTCTLTALSAGWARASLLRQTWQLLRQRNGCWAKIDPESTGLSGRAYDMCDVMHRKTKATKRLLLLRVARQDRRPLGRWVRSFWPGWRINLGSPPPTLSRSLHRAAAITNAASRTTVEHIGTDLSHSPHGYCGRNNGPYQCGTKKKNTHTHLVPNGVSSLSTGRGSALNFGLCMDGWFRG